LIIAGAWAHDNDLTSVLDTKGREKSVCLSDQMGRLLYSWGVMWLGNFHFRQVCRLVNACLIVWWLVCSNAFQNLQVL